jgi:post-segregation antitoxin (ccd killing protein)
MPIQDLDLSDHQRDLVAEYAKAHGLNIHDAATQAMQKAIAGQYLKKTGKTPATVYKFQPRTTP